MVHNFSEDCMHTDCRPSFRSHISHDGRNAKVSHTDIQIILKENVAWLQISEQKYAQNIKMFKNNARVFIDYWKFCYITFDVYCFCF